MLILARSRELAGRVRACVRVFAVAVADGIRSMKRAESILTKSLDRATRNERERER